MTVKKLTDMQFCKFDDTKLILKKVQPSPSQLLKKYYYTAYRLCPSCRRMYFSDEFKVLNSENKLFSDLENEAFDIRIWTDGASSRNGQADAKAAWAFVAGKHEEAGLVPGRQTNNRAEAYAIYAALRWANSKGYRRIKLYTDSQVTLFGVSKSHEKVKENRDIFALIAQEISANNLEVFYEKVLGHAGDRNNERADRLAVNFSQK